MSGLKTKRIVWTIVFLGITITAIVMELIAGIWHVSGTIPWTEYLAQYVPWPVQLIAYVALAVWLPFHFWRHDHMRKAAYDQGRTDGHAVGYALGRQDQDRLQRGNTPAACSHGVRWGTGKHVCMELPSDARRVESPPSPACCGHGYVWGSPYHTCTQTPSPLGGLLRATGAIGPGQDARVTDGG